MIFAQIILPLNLAGTFTYKVPEVLVSEIQPGMRVLVPFAGKKIYTGIVAELHQNEPTDFVAKEIVTLLDAEPILPKQQIEFWDWLSKYYLCNLGEIYRFAFPSSLKLESETYLKLKPHAIIDFENLDVNEMYIIQALEVRQLVNLTEIEAFIPKKDIVKTINALIDLQYIEIDEKIAEKYRAKEIAYVKLRAEVLAENSLAQILLQLKKAPKQQELFLALLEKHTEDPEILLRKSEVLESGNFAHSQLKALVEKNLVHEYFLQKDRLETYEGELEELKKLSDAQAEANLDVENAFRQQYNVLLHGVTSSGKTHIYLEQIEQVLAKNENVLYLVPEIALNKQIVQRLERKYGSRLGFYHQKLTDFERVEVWRKVKNNEINILIGTRNSLFLPFQNLALVIVDEEHDMAYRPLEVTPFFNAKDAAQVLAMFYHARVILGSATPSVESYFLASIGKLAYVRLDQRFGGVDLPKYELIDVKESGSAKTMVGNFSLQLLEEMKDVVAHEKQVMILHNKRGYSSVVECKSCGYVTYCSNCDVVMTYHKFSNEMKCHYCGQKASKPSTCPKCNSIHLSERGVGVEQIHEELTKLFPDADVDRMDVDSMRKKFAYEKLYEKIETGETDIIVGTQMISKGLDFENIELIGIPRADAMLHVQDFRAEERAYQLISQIAGRAGRSSGKGKVLIQSLNTHHPFFQLIRENDTDEIYERFLNEREKFNYPPYVRMVMIELKHRKEDKVNRASQFLASVLLKYLPAEYIFGPAKSPVAKVNLLYQYQLLLKFPRDKKYADFKKLLLKSFKEFEDITAYRSIKKLIFVDF